MAEITVGGRLAADCPGRFREEIDFGRKAASYRRLLPMTGSVADYLGVRNTMSATTPA